MNSIELASMNAITQDDLATLEQLAMTGVVLQDLQRYQGGLLRYTVQQDES